MIKRTNFLPLLLLFAAGALSAQNNAEKVKNYLNTSTSFRNVSTSNKEFLVNTEDYSASMKATVMQIQQTYGGIPVYNAYGSALIKEDKVIAVKENFVKNITAVAQENIQGVATVFITMMQKEGLQAVAYDLTQKGKNNSVLTTKMYYPKGSQLRLSYLYQFQEKDRPDFWSIVVDAANGDLLEKHNLTESCTFESHPYGRDHHVMMGPENQSPQNLSLLAPNNASYRVYALPVEAPTFGNRTLETNPWDLTASPEGWHSDGTNAYTYTRGNNVFAYTDVANTNTGAPENAAEGGSSRIFDFALDLTQRHTTYKDAAVTNLFYVNNKIHDILYRFGFNEEWRNFQTTNFTTLGAGADPVNAEARDASEASSPAFNNANFSTPPDGFSPRMQMYLWDPSVVNRLLYNAPSTMVSRKPNTARALFGPQLTTTGVTADVAVVTPINGCTDITEDLTGKIALIERGTCNFSVKVKNAQLKGAVAAIIYNATTSTTFGAMGGEDATVTIPSILILNAEGQAIIGNLSSTVNVTLSDDPSTYIYLDSDLDNGIIVHEYAHGISNRLVGTTATCLRASNTNEQMGEGWSDFYALMLTNQPGDTAAVPRGIGTFSSVQPTNGPGIRLAKYSPDFTVNNYTYGRTNGMYSMSGTTAQIGVHNVGFVWATMLWDLYWKYVEKYGYSADVMANASSGSARMLQLVTDALKLTPCSPTFVEARDAILLAEAATTNGADRCMIWGAFAKRGLGVNASAGLKAPAVNDNDNIIAAISDQVEDFTYPADCASVLSTSDVSAKQISIYPNPAKNEITIQAPTSISGVTMVSVYDMTGKLVMSEKMNLSQQKTLDITKLSNGVYLLKAEGIGVSFSQKIIVKK